MSDYDSGFLLEINSHSLFSKWFSESGKLVMKLFDHINEIADDPQSFVCILIGMHICFTPDCHLQLCVCIPKSGPNSLP